MSGCSGILTDHLNSVRLELDETGAVLDEGGAVLDQIAYDTFGNIVSQLQRLLDTPLLLAG